MIALIRNIKYKSQCKKLLNIIFNLVKELKNKKWKHVRDAYLKYVSEEKNVRSGSEGGTQRNRTHTHKLCHF